MFVENIRFSYMREDARAMTTTNGNRFWSRTKKKVQRSCKVMVGVGERHLTTNRERKKAEKIIKMPEVFQIFLTSTTELFSAFSLDFDMFNRDFFTFCDSISFPWKEKITIGSQLVHVQHMRVHKKYRVVMLN